MKRFLAIAVWLAMAVVCQAGDVVFTNTADFQGHVQQVRSAFVYFIDPPATNVTRDRVDFKTDLTGSFVITNYYPGNYRVEFQGTKSITTNWFQFPATNGVIMGWDAEWRRGLTNGAQLALTSPGADQRYLRIPTNSGSLGQVPSWTSATSTEWKTISSSGFVGDGNQFSGSSTVHVKDGAQQTNVFLRSVTTVSNLVGQLNGEDEPQIRLSGALVMDGTAPTYLLWDNSVISNIVVFSPETHTGQNILYIGAGNDPAFGGFDADSLQIRNSNSSAQVHGQLAPRHTFMFRNSANTYTEGWRMERTNFTLSTPYNTAGVAIDPATAGFYQSFIAHNNTNWMELGVRGWTNRLTGQGVEVGQFAEIGIGTNNVAIGNATNTTSNTALIGYGNFNAQFSASNIRLGNTAFVVSPTELDMFLDAFVLDPSGNGLLAGDLEVDGTISGDGSGITSLNGSAISSGTVDPARLGSGSSITTKFLRGDSTWQTVSVGSGGGPSAYNPTQFSTNQTANQLDFISGGVVTNLTIEGNVGHTNAVYLDSDSFIVSNSFTAMVVSNDASGALNFRIGPAATTTTNFMRVTKEQNIALGFKNEITLGGDRSMLNNSILGGHGSTIGTTNIQDSTIAGGTFNSIQCVDPGNSTFRHFIGSGFSNVISSGFQNVIAGGQLNQITGGQDSIILGGNQNLVSASLATAGGFRANAIHASTFVWSDGQSATFSSAAANTFNIRATGGAFFDLGTSTLTNRGSMQITNSLVVGTNGPIHGTNVAQFATADNRRALEINQTIGKIFANVPTTFQAGVTNNSTLTNSGTADFGGTVMVGGNLNTAGTVAATNGFIGDGSKITGVWVKEILSGGAMGGTIGTGDKFAPVSFGLAAVNSTQGQIAHQLPLGGYLSNLVVYVGSGVPTTTNIVFCVQTNAAILSAPADSAMTCTYLGNTVYRSTNDSTHAIALGSTMGVLSVGDLRINASSILNLNNPISLSWTVEWWHQSP